MALTESQRAALANDSRIQALKVKIAKLQGINEQSQSFARLLSTQNADTQIRLQTAQTELDALQLGAGPGITEEFGDRSIVDNAASAERTAGQIACIMAAKANPDLTQEEALTIWTTAALAARPADRQWLLNNPVSVLMEYLANLVAAGQIAEPTWAALAAWVLATPIEDIP